MAKTKSVSLHIEHLVYFIRGQRIMLDSDLATVYGVPTKVLNQAVKRNIDRFPKDFMFELNFKEWELIKTQRDDFDLRSQFVTSNVKSQNVTSNIEQNLKSQSTTSKRGGRRTLPFVFTEHGAVMLASTLNSPQAIAASIQIVKVFVKLREILSTHKQLAKKLEELEGKYDKQFKEVFDALRELMTPHNAEKERLMLKKGVKE
ncbi:MAG TPA: ORF6N domain-containing protein [Ignavibacteria bacterium]